MKKYNITLTEDQALLIARVLDDVGRFAAGQMSMDFTLSKMIYDKDKVESKDFSMCIEKQKEAEAVLKSLRPILFPELIEGASYGFNGTNFIGNLYQISRTILYKMAQDKGWNNVYNSEPLKSGDLGPVEVEILGDSELT